MILVNVAFVRVLVQKKLLIAKFPSMWSNKHQRDLRQER